MKIECPSCRLPTEVDAVNASPSGIDFQCPGCSTLLFITPDGLLTLKDDPVKEACPKCGFRQNPSESCVRCGIVYVKYKAVETRRQSEAGTSELEEVNEVRPLSEADKRPFRFGYGRGEIMSWVEEGRLAVEDLPKAINVAGMLPGPIHWRRFLDGLMLWMGSVFLAAAVIFFFAYNWHKLGHFTRFGIMELLLAAAVFASWRLGFERISGKAALLVATLLAGALLALVDQTYQTGADSWTLFATWALFVLPWVAISRFSPLWLFWLTLLNVAINLYFTTLADFSTYHFSWWILTAVNTTALIAWELAAHHSVYWTTDRWAPRIIATAALGYITLLAARGILETNAQTIFELFGYLFWLGGAYLFYRHGLKDLYVLALGVLSLLIFITIFLGEKLLSGGGEGALLLIGIIVLGLSAAGGWWLRTVAREVEA
jgi:uncharacterized membrane protein